MPINLFSSTNLVCQKADPQTTKTYLSDEATTFITLTWKNAAFVNDQYKTTIFRETTRFSLLRLVYNKLKINESRLCTYFLQSIRQDP